MTRKIDGRKGTNQIDRVIEVTVNQITEKPLRRLRGFNTAAVLYSRTFRREGVKKNKRNRPETKKPTEAWLLINKKLGSLRASQGDAVKLGKWDVFNKLTEQMIRMQIELHDMALMQIELIRSQLRIELAQAGRRPRLRSRTSRQRRTTVTNGRRASVA